jgi:hypothetical protein
MNQPADDGSPSPTPAPTDDQLFVIGSDAQAFRSLAALAPGLSEAELRTCLHLASIQDPVHHSVRASSRDIAEATRLARANVVRAIDSLNRKCLITTRQGGGQTASAHLLNWVQTTPISTKGSGLTARPLAQTTLDLQAAEWSRSETTSPSHNGPSISIDSDSILDRVLTARPQHFQKSQLEAVKGYAYKWLLIQRGKQHAQPPDDHVCARLIAAAGGAVHACDWIRDHLADKQAETPEYLVRWMLEKIHGIPPHTARRRNAELRAVQRTPAAPDAGDSTEDLQQQIAAIARSKSIR